MSWERVELQHDGAVATITLNHPESRNALSWKLAHDFCQALDCLSDARALVIAGAGKGFCSGGDLSSSPKSGQGFGDMLADGLNETVNPLMLKLANLNIPVVNAINGAAAGAGASLALSGDFVIAGNSAFFYFAFPNVGLALDAGASWLLPRLVGHARAMQALMLAERIPAQQALDWGMIYKVVPDESILDEATALAHRLASGPTMAYGLIRHSVRDAQGGTYKDALLREVELQRVTGNSKDCAEAVSAFLEKRSPVFRGE